MASLKRRGKTYYAQDYLAGEQKRVNLETASLQVAKEMIRQIESALARECDTATPFPCRPKPPSHKSSNATSSS
jgi:hypothetical protein